MSIELEHSSPKKSFRERVQSGIKKIQEDHAKSRAESKVKAAKRKEIYQESYEKAEVGAIQQKAKRDAKSKYAPQVGFKQPKRESSGSGINFRPSSEWGSALFGEQTKTKKKTKKKKSNKKYVIVGGKAYQVGSKKTTKHRKSKPKKQRQEYSFWGV